MAVQESSRCTPFEAMFGRQAKLPIDFNLDEDYDPDKKLKQHLSSHDPPEEAIAMHRKRIEETVKKNVEKALRKQKEYYDEKHGASSCYTIGSLVYKKVASTPGSLSYAEREPGTHCLRMRQFSRKCFHKTLRNFLSPRG